MNNELLRIVDAIHRDKNIDTEIVFSGIESAYLTAAKKYFGEEEDIEVKIDRQSGEILAKHNGAPITADTLGRIATQSAKQIMIQKFREAERDTLFDEFIQDKGTVVTGIVQRSDGAVTTVNVGKTEAILPRSEQIPGETFRPAERVRAVILDVRKSGQRVKIILSRTHPDFVRRLFEQEIPEIAEHIIEIRAIAREAGYRTKVAVSSIDSKVDCVGACVGVRGGRIKNILEEFGGERIDIIRYNESLQVMIPNALAPAQIEEVQIYTRVGRAIVLVKEDQLSLAIGKKGQNVRLASKLCSIDIEIMTFEELTEEIDKAESYLSQLPGVTEEAVDALIEEGIFSYDDVWGLEPEQLMEIAGVDEETALTMVEYAETASEQQVESRSRDQHEPARETESGAESAAEPSMTAAEQLLGPAEPEPEEKAPTVRDVFGQAPPAPKEEKRITAAELFGDDRQQPTAAGGHETEKSGAGE